MSNNELVAISHLINPAVDWTKADLNHLSAITIDVKPTISRRKVREIIDSKYWPEAVPQNLIVSTDEARKQRADAIITSYCGTDLHGKRILDFGCGNGDCVKAAIELGAKAIGFDIVEHQDWDNQHFTTDEQQVSENGPYDIIIIYDVIDYMIENNKPQFGVLRKLPSLLAPGGRVYVRCCPYSARTIQELYLIYNKAYAHLFFPITEFLADPTPSFKITNLNTYHLYFTRLGFNILKTINIRTKVEDVVVAMMPTMIESFTNDWKVINVITKNQIIDVMEVQHMDFVLSGL